MNLYYTTMYTRQQLLTEIERLYAEMDEVQNALILSRLNKEPEKEAQALRRMERLYVGIQQDLTCVHDYLVNENRE